MLYSSFGCSIGVTCFHILYFFIGRLLKKTLTILMHERFQVYSIGWVNWCYYFPQYLIKNNYYSNISNQDLPELDSQQRTMRGYHVHSLCSSKNVSPCYFVVRSDVPSWCDRTRAHAPTLTRRPPAAKRRARRTTHTQHGRESHTTFKLTRTNKKANATRDLNIVSLSPVKGV